MKKYVKKGFLDEYEVKKMFKKQSVQAEVEEQDKGEWIKLLVEALEAKV